MHKMHKPLFIAILAAAIVFILTSSPALTGDIILTHNSGSESKVFVVEGEPSLVINGFDLSPTGMDFPVAVDAVSISVVEPVPGATLLVYQDANGGSPVDAELVYQQPAGITSAGYNRIILNEAALVTEPVIWVGFYLPVGFRFNADTSGSSVLTYWGWAPGSIVDPKNLRTARILGPGDGTSPVAIDMQGIARITTEVREPYRTETKVVIGLQMEPEFEQDTSIMQPYPYCGTLLFDPEDIAITGGSSFKMSCDVKQEFDAPTEVINPSGQLLDVQRAGHLFKLEAQIPPQDQVQGATNTLPVEVTHCLEIIPSDLGQAVIAEARGIPERWHVLPSVRFDELVCAEVTTASFISYFLPRGEDSPQNVNLVPGWSHVEPHPIECGLPTYLRIPVVNTGQHWFDTPTGDVKIIVENLHVRTGTVTGAIEIKIETSYFGPGNRHIVEMGPIYVDQYVNELHRLQVRIDFDNQVEETNDFDNTWFTEYVLAHAAGSSRCYVTSWLTATPYPSDVEDFCFVGQPAYRDRDKLVIPHSPSCKIEVRRGNVQDPSAIEMSLRNCTFRIKSEVEQQEALIRYSLVNCSGSRQVNVEMIRDREAWEVILDTNI